MSAKQRIGRLEELLARVQSRAAQPRTNGAAYAAAPAAMPAVQEEEEHTQLDAVQTADVRTSPPPADAASPSQAFGDDDAEVEVSSEVVEVDIDVDEPIAAESGQQPVAYATEPPAELEVVEEDEAPGTQRAPDEPAVAASPANEIEEPAPSSSRRPIADDVAAAGAYEEESSPRHTPPPESGKQVAVSPSTHPPRKSSVPPPPSLEGHTLIGGWREPGLAQPPGGGQGVRVPPPPQAGAAPPPPVPAAAGSSPQVSPPQASGTRLSPDVTRPDLPQGAKVAAIEGSSQVAKPATMGDLLDLTLGL